MMVKLVGSLVGLDRVIEGYRQAPDQVPAEVEEMTHRWRWRNPPGRMGRVCRVLARGAKGISLYEFADGFLVTAPWRAARRER
jgi:hypothetical protein